MATRTSVLPPPVRRGRLPKVLGLSMVFLLAVWFIERYALHYLVHFTPASYNVYWTRRGWLLLHILGQSSYS